MDTVSETAKESQKAALETSELLQNLLVGMENLGDNVKQLREEVNAWGEPEGQEILDELMTEIPIVSSASEQPQVSNQTPTVNLQTPPTNDPISSSPASGSTPVRSDSELEDRRKRVAALKTGSPANFVSQSGAQGKVQISSVEIGRARV